MTDDDLIRTAYHECGHAVAAVLLGGQIEKLTLEPEEDFPLRFGEIQVAWPDELGITDRELAIREIKVSLAGPIVEMIYDGNQFAPTFLEEWRFDWELAVDRATNFLSKEKSVPEHLAHIAYQVLQFFDRDDVWAAVAALSDELQAHESLDSEDIADVMDAWPVLP